MNASRELIRESSKASIGDKTNGPRNPFTQGGLGSEFDSRSNVNKSKWTLKAFREYLKNLKENSPDDPNVKKLDISNLFSKIHDIVVKTIISAEPLLWNGVEMYVPN